MYKSATEMRGVSQTRERERTREGGARRSLVGPHDTHAGGGLGRGTNRATHIQKNGQRRDKIARRNKKQGFFVDGGGDGQNKYKECRSAIQEEARITCRVCNDQSASKVVICGGVGT